MWGSWAGSQRPHRAEKKPETVARFEVQILPNRLWDGDLVRAAEGGFHVAVVPSFTFYQK